MDEDRSILVSRPETLQLDGLFNFFNCLIKRNQGNLRFKKKDRADARNCFFFSERSLWGFGFRHNLIISQTSNAFLDDLASRVDLISVWFNLTRDSKQTFLSSRPEVQPNFVLSQTHCDSHMSSKAKLFKQPSHCTKSSVKLLSSLI